MQPDPLIPGERIAKLLNYEKSPSKVRAWLESQGVRVWCMGRGWFVHEVELRRVQDGSKTELL